MVDDPDRELLDRFVRGEQESLEVLFRRFEREVFGWILRIVRDPNAAEDVLAESFLRAYRARARFDPTRSFGAWMRRIATNASLDHLRSERHHAGSNRLLERASAPPVSNRELRDAIAVAFGRLPPKLQVVAVLAHIEERPHAEIAAALGVPLGTVKSRLSRAVARLTKELARLGIRP